MIDSLSPHSEIHRSHRAPWLRAAVLGVNDGIVSTSSLMLGVSAASQSNAAVLTAGLAGVVAGALSMAVGEYVSVSSQKDSELTDVQIEQQSINDNPEAELNELTSFYENQGLSSQLAKKVAIELHQSNALNAHITSELGFTEKSIARPIDATIASGVAFTAGGIVPVFTTAILYKTNYPNSLTIILISLIALFISGAIGAYIGGGHKIKAATRVLVGGGLAMLISLMIGSLIGRAI